jgi:predicted secreted hydrolase
VNGVTRVSDPRWPFGATRIFDAARACLATLLLAPAACWAGTADSTRGVPPDHLAPSYAPVLAGHPLEFPADYGSHPDFHTEWWYVTGWLSTAGAETLGFQITFFRTKPAVDATNPSAFTAHQILIAHCALSDPKLGRLWHDQKIRRAGFGLAVAAGGDTDVQVDGWSLRRVRDVYAADLAAEEFALHLKLAATQAPLLNGEGGMSRKGASPAAASYYYSLPHLAVSGTIERAGRADSVQGEAWIDHEWSSAYLEDGAVGWDWTGINLSDGGALMAFRIRGASGEALWAGGTWRRADGGVEVFGPRDIGFEPQRTWRSPRTGAVYPIEARVRVGSREIRLAPLMDDQENDTRLSTGAVYWEGAVRAVEAGRAVGRGYLELTGYVEPLQLR